MIKLDLVKAITAKTGQKQDEVDTIVEAIFKQIKKAVVGGNTIYLRGFGNFETAARAARKAHVIKTKTFISIPAHRVPKLKFSKEFRELVKKGGQKC